MTFPNSNYLVCIGCTRHKKVSFFDFLKATILLMLTILSFFPGHLSPPFRTLHWTALEFRRFYAVITSHFAMLSCYMHHPSLYTHLQFFLSYASVRIFTLHPINHVIQAARMIIYVEDRQASWDIVEYAR